jgi:hypothetical protein
MSCKQVLIGDGSFAADDDDGDDNAVAAVEVVDDSAKSVPPTTTNESIMFSSSSCFMRFIFFFLSDHGRDPLSESCERHRIKKVINVNPASKPYLIKIPNWSGNQHN